MMRAEDQISTHFLISYKLSQHPSEKSQRGSIILWRSGGFVILECQFGGTVRIYLAVYGPKIIGGFGLEEITKAVCGLGRTNYGSLRSVRPPNNRPSPTS